MYNRKTVFAAACLGMLIFGIVLISLGSILPDVIKRFAIDEVTAGSLTALLPLGILLGSLFFGPFVDRYGYKYLLIISTLLVFAGLEAIAFGSEFFILQAAVFVIGLGGGALNGGTNALVSDISETNKGASLSLLGVFFGIGALGMPAILGILTGRFAYDSVLSIIALFLLIPFIYFIIVKFPEPKHTQGFPVKESLSLFKEPLLILLGLLLFFESGMEGIVNNWTTTYLTKDLLVDGENALFALTLFVIGMTLARLALGFVLKNLPSDKVLSISLGISFVAGLVLYFGATYTFALIALFMFGVGFAAAFPVILSYVGELYSHLSGTAFSFVLVIALTGNMVLNYVTGLVAYYMGIGNFVLIILISVVLMYALLVYTLGKKRAAVRKAA